MAARCMEGSWRGIEWLLVVQKGHGVVARYAEVRGGQVEGPKRGIE